MRGGEEERTAVSPLILSSSPPPLRPCSHSLLHVSSEMWNDAKHPLDEHELAAVVHLVLLRREESFKARARVLAHRIGVSLREEFRGQRLHPRREEFPFAFE